MKRVRQTAATGQPIAVLVLLAGVLAMHVLTTGHDLGAPWAPRHHAAAELQLFPGDRHATMHVVVDQATPPAAATMADSARPRVCLSSCVHEGPTSPANPGHLLELCAGILLATVSTLLLLRFMRSGRSRAGLAPTSLALLSTLAPRHQHSRFALAVMRT